MPAKENNLKGSLKWTAQSQANAVRYKWQQGDFARKAKELFMLNAKDVTYEPLQSPSHIRLLTLEPGSSPGSIIRCSLRCVDLDDRPEYTALSYTWKLDHTVLSGGYAMAKSYAKTFLRGGDPRFEIPQDTGEARISKEIVCDGNVIKISPNLYNALVQLRRKRAGDYWVDAICINQNDQKEKAAQVQYMGEIYKRASQVVVWLGTSGEDLTRSVEYLDHLTTNALDIPPVSFSDLNDLVGENDERLIPYNAIYVAISIVMSQWFRRTWVIQELCWAEKVVFAMGNAELSIQCVVKAFDVARTAMAAAAQSAMTVFKNHPDNDQDIGWFAIAAILKSLSRVWTPQVPITLETRETFHQGEMWTLRQWLMVCRGRLATNPRDLVFAGLSLIKPDLLVIDQSLQCSEPTPLLDSSHLPFPLRKYYPQIIPPTGLKQPDRPSRRWGTSLKSQSTPILPTGLWPKLTADYEVGISDVLINTAACLLTHTGTEEILSIAARTSRPEKFSSGWWMVVPGDQLAEESLPSWVPAPGFWASHVSEIEAFRLQSPPRVGVSATDRPRISKDGSALFLGASRVDVIDQFYLDFTMGSAWDAGESTKPLDVMLAAMAKHRRQPLLTALSKLLFGPNIQQPPHVSGDENMWILHQLSYSTCAEIARLRTNQLHKRVRRFNHPKQSSDEFAVWFGRSQKKACARADETLSLFATVRAAYPDENWPEWADPVQFDMEIHKAFLRQLAKSPSPSTGSGSTPVHEGQHGSASSATASDKTQTPASKAGAIEELRDAQEKALLSKLSPQDPEQYASLAAQAQTKLAWRKVFITRGGFLGLGPSWLHRGDTIMLIRGAKVPYAFTPLQTDVQRREKDVREAMDSNQKKYNEIAKTLQAGKGRNAYLHPIDNVVHSHGLRKLERLDEEQERLDRKLDNVSATPPWKDAWVLQGEVAIESALEQQAMDRGAWERVTVV